MAIIETQKLDKGLFGLWKITEEVEELLPLANLSSPDLEKWSAIKSIQRKKEWLATRALLNELTGKVTQISYHPDGRPFLNDLKTNISISHTKGYAAILLYETTIPGVDIELDSRSAEKVATRILSPEELDSCRENEGYSNKKILVHWCAKEVIFKIVPEHSVSYLNQIHIAFNGSIDESHSFPGNFQSEAGLVSINLFYKSIEDLIIVWGWVDSKA